MGYSKLIKALTLTGFVILLAGFIAYRTGALKSLIRNSKGNHIKSMEMNHPVDSPILNASDTLNKGDDTSNFVIMSSSKSIQLSQPGAAKLVIPKSQQEYFDSLPDSTNENIQEVNMMSSSKSTLIFQAASKQKSKKESGESKQEYLMSSSKSGHIFLPDTPAINYFELKFPKVKMDSLK